MFNRNKLKVSGQKVIPVKVWDYFYKDTEDF